MDKLVERETAPRNPLAAAPALAVQFFLIPLVVVGITVGLYVGFRSLIADERDPQQYLAEIRYGGWYRQWPAAYELSQLMADPKIRADKTLGPELVKAFDEAKDADPRVRRYLALAIGRLDPPLSADAVATLSRALDEGDSDARISAIWALGSSGDPSVVPRLEALYQSSDDGIRKMVVYALGGLPGDAQIATLRTALQDSAVDVRWNAAVALARHDRREGVDVLKQMLDRTYVEQVLRNEAIKSERTFSQNDDRDPIADVMISGLRAAARLKDSSLRPSIEGLSQQDRSLRVRQAALEALKAIG
jgi:HEAT repeat protein